MIMMVMMMTLLLLLLLLADDDSDISGVTHFPFQPWVWRSHFPFASPATERSAFSVRANNTLPLILVSWIIPS
uniref:Putative secreted protein n=1 Tax=Anopheles marajoara TaxID=58244 RepID=A0A2M4CDM4_9DIPT